LAIEKGYRGIEQNLRQQLPTVIFGRRVPAVWGTTEIVSQVERAIRGELGLAQSFTTGMGGVDKSGKKELQVA